MKEKKKMAQKQTKSNVIPFPLNRLPYEYLYAEVPASEIYDPTYLYAGLVVNLIKQGYPNNKWGIEEYVFDEKTMSYVVKLRLRKEWVRENWRDLNVR